MKKTLLALLTIFGMVGMANAQGTAEAPLTVDQLIEQGVPESAVADTYVKGYIVGWIEGTKYATGAHFSTPATVATNIILAGSSSETDTDYCIPVQLPSGDIRKALNLVDHPENLGHEIVLCGSNDKYFGANGLKSVSSYTWVGEAPEVTVPSYPAEVTGTAQNPLGVEAFLAQGTPASSIPGTFLKGVIVGYVPGMAFTDAVLGVSGEVSYTNVLLAANADVTDINECVPVQLPSGDLRRAVNLYDNPGNLGKTITLYGDHEAYFGQNGLKNVTLYAWGDEEIDVPVVVPAIYTGLAADADGWTFDNVSLAEGLSYVWAWDAQYKCLKGAAFVNAKLAAESYAISPVVDLTNVENAGVNFDHAAKFQDNLRTDCKFVVREEGAADWTELTIPTWPEAGAWTFVNSGNIDLSAYAGKKIQCAFKYVSTSQAADTWEIKNFSVTGQSGVNEVVAPLEVYVVNGNIVAPEGAKVYGLNGAAYGTENLAKGLYIVVCGQKAIKVLVK